VIKFWSAEITQKTYNLKEEKKELETSTELESIKIVIKVKIETAIAPRVMFIFFANFFPKK